MGVRQILPHHWDSASNLDVFAAGGFFAHASASSIAR
jgi:hypothetical protein